ncbi:hypothetical protein DPMN_006902 [Dreissena polymorpha]|uniref:Uncharacterized protein n=1 Tax=Dreissena polymorpha TaxID=45954 RepID=A0A9D4MVH6_DREPO|nr:hypothetical protein DPMN_006902 [Dreissena polymorpha]
MMQRALTTPGKVDSSTSCMSSAFFDKYAGICGPLDELLMSTSCQECHLFNVCEAVKPEDTRTSPCCVLSCSSSTVHALVTYTTVSAGEISSACKQIENLIFVCLK